MSEGTPPITDESETRFVISMRNPDPVKPEILYYAGILSKADWDGLTSSDIDWCGPVQEAVKIRHLDSVIELITKLECLGFRDLMVLQIMQTYVQVSPASITRMVTDMKINNILEKLSADEKELLTDLGILQL